MEAIRLESVNKSFGPTKAVRELSLIVESREIRGLLGPNGSGKTTTMKMILGILKPDSGRIVVNGVDVKQNPVSARRIEGYVPETPQLYEYLTAGEYLDFVGAAYRIEPSLRKERVEELTKALQMDQRLNELMSGFSQGMRQKIALVAALLHKPQVLVLDEVLNGLDPRSARIVKELLYHLAGEGAAILFSTHVLEIAEAMCHRVTIMNQGSMLAEGSLQELRSKAGLLDSNLEEVFLKLTGSDDTAQIVEALRL